MEVSLTGTLRSAAGDAASVQVEAATIAELLERLTERFPEMKRILDTEGIAVSIDGEIYRDDWRIKIPEGAEVFLLPRVPGG